MAEVKDTRAPTSAPTNIAVGIDLGTTNSLVAFVDASGKCHIIPLYNQALDSAKQTAKYMLPSVVAITQASGSIVGEEALSIAPEHCFRSIKRLIGKSLGELLSDTDSGAEKSDELAKTNAGNNENPLQGQIMMQAADGIFYSPIDISALILKRLKQAAEQHLDTQIKSAVITVPAHFNEAQRLATKAAAKMAGLEVLRLLNEPTAAAVAYGLDQVPQGLFLVFDLGGGTFDSSLLELKNGVFRVLATGGDNNLGGDDFDMRLYALLMEKIRDKYQVDHENPLMKENAHMNIQNMLEVRFIKEYLSSNEFWAGQFAGYHDLHVSRQEAESVWQDLIMRMRDVLEQVVADAGVANNSDIAEVILVGGATRMPLVQQVVADFWGAGAKSELDPDQIVAMGAAIQARALMQPADHLLLDVTPLSLGMETLNDRVEIVIPRNTPIPARVTKSFTTAADNQTAFHLHVVQGEGELVQDCRSLAIFTLQDLPPGPAGKARLDITFAIDADGLLTVSAQEKTTAQSYEIEIKPSFGLGEDELLELLMKGYKA